MVQMMDYHYIESKILRWYNYIQEINNIEYKIVS